MLDLVDLMERPRVGPLPKAGTQEYALLHAFKLGKRFTVLTAIQELGIFALSQRCGALKRMGWPVMSRTIAVGSKHVSEYWMD